MVTDSYDIVVFGQGAAVLSAAGASVRVIEDAITDSMPFYLKSTISLYLPHNGLHTNQKSIYR